MTTTTMVPALFSARCEALLIAFVGVCACIGVNGLQGGWHQQHPNSFRCHSAASTSPFANCRGIGREHAFDHLRRHSLVTFAASSEGDSDSDANPSDEELLQLIRGPLGMDRPRVKPKAIFVLSDGTAVTAKSVIEKTITTQFNGCDQRFFNVRLPTSLSTLTSQTSDEEDFYDDDDDDDDEICVSMATKVYPFLQSESEVAAIIKEAEDFNALLVFTFAGPELRGKTARMCELSQIKYVDLIGPMFESMSMFFEREPLGRSVLGAPPSSRRALSDSYYRRIEAVEFTLKCDDGRSPQLLSEADVILLGVSRTGKTPLSVVLAQTMGLKVANIPLVVDLSPPAQLFDSDRIDPKRVFCLTLDINDLMRIRRNRLRKEMRKIDRRLSRRSTYADRAYLERDIAHAKQIATENKYTLIDVTGRAVEETASFVSSMLNERFPGSVSEV
eukprot:CAMPEP_0198114362 /NCGR_PEP_ID=MMETSP1442-20131203/5771_1 /TAXON_ID= /ORGANISM="Craspedostauros australis, Strain CCMP3328" /LENGTH=444 /DNA_ID=CAMNT_0043771661 /DNA_START=13 /DNA_END=1347 /DNA_ORIENTATION=+